MTPGMRGVKSGAGCRGYFVFKILMVLSALIWIQSAIAGEAYDESVDFAPPYSVNQNDPSLANLFDPSNGKSSLCVPTTLANIVADQFAWREPNFSKLRLIAQPEQEDYAQQVRTFAQQCGTSPTQGTIVSKAAQCLRNFYRQSGYLNSWVYLIGNEENTDPQSVQFFHGARPLSINDIRYYVSNQVGVFMDIFWEEAQQDDPIFGPPTTTWSQKGGHTFMIAGYDYDLAWGQSQIQLKVVNPLSDYIQGDSLNHYDEITMTSVVASQEKSFPPGFTYVLSGPGFDSQTVRAYVRNILVALPDRSVSPTPSIE